MKLKEIKIKIKKKETKTNKPESLDHKCQQKECGNGIVNLQEKIYKGTKNAKGKDHVTIEGRANEYNLE